ncbi:MAG: hypothetical protein HZA78_07010 [Candidatus Schekmanbacteria bacterium]|nr:hypothetical protein [Candidatus Schekmanbacteria bacterium]
MKRSVAVILFAVFAVCMIVVVLHLYPVGDPRLPGYADFIPAEIPSEEIPRRADSVATYYNRNSARDVGGTCVIASVILDYRGYDTLYEATVLFTAVIACLALIGKDHHHE